MSPHALRETTVGSRELDRPGSVPANNALDEGYQHGGPTCALSAPIPVNGRDTPSLANYWRSGSAEMLEVKLPLVRVGGWMQMP